MKLQRSNGGARGQRSPPDPATTGNGGLFFGSQKKEIGMGMAHASLLAPAVPDKSVLLSGEVFGELINLSGRRRFTSQRIVLYAVLAAQGDVTALATAREALEQFRSAHDKLIRGDGTLPGVFCDELHEVYFGKHGGDRQIRDFIEHSERTLMAIERQEVRAPTLLAELVKATTPILATLNKITSVYETESRAHALQMKAQLRGMIADIEMIANQAKMVAINARIVAARAGQAGQEFSVVARVLSAITTKIEEMIKVALKFT
jgi:hypothetical protein